MDTPQPVMIVPLDSFNTMLEKMSSMEIMLRDIRRQGLSSEPENSPLTEEGYYYGDEIRQKLGWSKSTWTQGKKNQLTLNGNMILERDTINSTRYRCKRADLHKWLLKNNTARYNELFK